ncbi:unnamed protein product [Thlaspi arvense]|uniref:Uncharacterized protein n=1 Tax=Thlaspi arvense TaxID=13288 RepID=A0AAU9R8A8_THLAR|nr:unnamed protein product [Thlaspi arvense]
MSSEATESQLQLVPAYGSSSDNKSTADSFRMPTYEDLVRNSDLFWDNLRDLLGHLDKTLK